MFGYFNGSDTEGVYILRRRVNEERGLKIQGVERSCPSGPRMGKGWANRKQGKETSPLRRNGECDGMAICMPGHRS